MRLRHQTKLLAVLVVTSVTPLGFAIDPEPAETTQGKLNLPTTPTATATIEQILDTAVQNIARRYNLNEAQTQRTNELMKTEVHRFLLEHEDEVWPVIRDLLSAQALGGPPDDPEMMKRIGKAASPLARLAQKAIFDANEEWRGILSDEQRALHDYDLSEMRKNFDSLHGRMQAWSEGRRADGGGMFPQAEPPGRLGPRRPRKPAERRLPDVKTNVSTLFDTFVAEFIKDYHLDESQIVTARSILKEFKAKATDFKNAKKREFAKLAGDERKAIDDRNRAKLREVESARKKLLEPVHELFAQMQARLTGLLTTAQRQQYAAAKRPETGGKSKPAPRKKKTTTEGTKTPVDRKLTSSTKAKAKANSEQ